jgi:hypothetical protein
VYALGASYHQPQDCQGRNPLVAISTTPTSVRLLYLVVFPGTEYSLLDRLSCFNAFQSCVKHRFWSSAILLIPCKRSMALHQVGKLTPS